MYGGNDDAGMDVRQVGKKTFHVGLDFRAVSLLPKTTACLHSPFLFGGGGTSFGGGH